MASGPDAFLPLVFASQSFSLFSVMNLVRVFQPRRKPKGEEADAPAENRTSRPTHRPKLQEQQRKSRGGRPVLDRCNAFKKTNYDAWAVHFDDSMPGGAGAGADKGRLVHSVDVPPMAASAPELPLVVHFASQTSFRISGDVDGEFDIVCRSLGVSGPDDFAITLEDLATACWISSDVRSGSDAPHADRDDTSMDIGAAAKVKDREETPREEPRPLTQLPEAKEEEGQASQDAVGNGFRFEVAVTNAMPDLVDKPHFFENTVDRPNRGGIRGARPSPLAPPPPMSLPPLNRVTTTWDIFSSLAPDDGQEAGATCERRESPEEEDKGANEEGNGVSFSKNAELEVDKWVRMGVTSTDLTTSCSFCTSHDDDSSSTTTEGMSTISPNGKLRRDIRSWEKGQLLGSGSFGTVYEAMSADGFFFAVKEVYLLDEGTNALQCINQLEQEIALLSQFEHENIVQYLGTTKEEGKLCIFLELVSQGSLASLYQKYHFQDSQVSAYTRQILNGLRYLHDRNVVHRDIKCSNILVAANGSVKLADFGLAKKRTQFSDIKSCKGSVYWMAPEVVIPRRTYGPSADIWSLGCTVLEMLTQQHPFSDLEWTQALFHIGRGGQPPIPDSLSTDARDFIQQCTRVDPHDRPSASRLLDHPFVKKPLPTSSPDSAMIWLEK